MKRLWTILASLALCACLLVGCGKDNKNSSEATKDTTSQAAFKAFAAAMLQKNSRHKYWSREE